MRTTPPLDEWIKDFRTPGYRNIYEDEFCPAESRLYGTESLFPSWDAEILLLAKDFAPAVMVRERKNRGHARPFSHFDEFPTNSRLCRLVNESGLRPAQVLYGSAYAGLLRDDGKRSGNLPSLGRVEHEELQSHLGKILTDFVVLNMPKLRAIVCLGTDAWKVVANTYEFDPRLFASYREGRKHHNLESRNLKVFALYHPVQRVLPHADIVNDWKTMVSQALAE